MKPKTRKARPTRSPSGLKFFKAMHIPLLTGRTFVPEDFISASTPTRIPVVINEAFVRQYFGNRNPIGRRITVFGRKGTPCEIIGVVGDAKYQTLRSELRATAYVSQKDGNTNFEVRTATDPATIIPAICNVASQLDPQPAALRHEDAIRAG